MERLERSRLSDCVVAAEEKRRFSSDRVGQVFELEPVRVDEELDSFDLSVATQLDHRRSAVPGIVEEERSLAADRLELVTLGEAGTAVELGEDVMETSSHP